MVAINDQQSRIAELEAALWRDPADGYVLDAYQAAHRELETLMAQRDDDPRHLFVVVIPVADSPRHLRTCLDSLLQQCRAYGYGGRQGGHYSKVRVLLADDSQDDDHIERNHRIARDVDRAGLRVEYFGLGEQRELMRRLRDIDLGGIVGRHPDDAFAHKGQAMMRNIAYLRLAELRARLPDQRLLFYTIDADQAFAVNVATPRGGRDIAAISYFHQLDRLFADDRIEVLTGKVVGDPPVSPAVMTGRFLDDVIAFLGDVRQGAAGDLYRQPSVSTRGSGEAAYHDMAEMFGFGGDGDAGTDAYRYHCRCADAPSNAACFADFARHLNRFLHGEHPTRITWYRHAPLAGSVQPARTVYTGNYVFRARALDWFIPFAPLRLRMSGPTMGRILKAELGDGFVSANLPMLHRRTLDSTGAAEFRPGVVDQQAVIDLADEFERQFYGDVMLFSMERLTAEGFPGEGVAGDRVAAILDTVYVEMRDRYRARQQSTLQRLQELRTMLDDPSAWWNASVESAPAVTAFNDFVDNIERNFGDGSRALAGIEAAAHSRQWRGRQLEAIEGLRRDRRMWRQAVERLMPDVRQ